MTTKAERVFHRKEAVRCFNRTWEYLVKRRRTRDDDQKMLALAHASLYHWDAVGKPRIRAVARWQVSRVYAALGQPELALLFAESALSTCRRNRVDEVLPTMYEAVARAYAVGKDARDAKRFLARARLELDRVTLEKEDRRIFLGQIRDTQRLIDRL